VFDFKLKELMVQMKQLNLEDLLPLVSFLHTFDKRNGLNMLALMLDPRFKNTHYHVGHETIVVHVLIEYDKKLLLFLLMEVNKLLMPNKVETTFIFTHELILKVYFTPHQQQQTYIGTCQGHLFDFNGFLLM